MLFRSWHLIPSRTWSATVSLAFYLPSEPHASEAILATSVRHQVGNVCTTPEQLKQLLRKASLLAHYPTMSWHLLTSLDEDSIALSMNAVAQSLSGGIIYVELQGGHGITQDLTIVDVPG